MQIAQPSRTAQRVAARRALHQLLDCPRVFEDPLAVAMAGDDEGVTARDQHELLRALRAFIAVRSRYAEDQLALAVSRGVRQYVVLGAGLDTFAYRNPLRSTGLRIFEVDHPATQEWKRERLREKGIAIPEDVTFAAVDFEVQSLGDGLREAGFDQGRAASFSWLGVTPYLSRAAFDATIGFIASLPPGSGVTFDYAVERRLLSEVQQRAFDVLAKRVASVGEPFQLLFDPAQLGADLARAGFGSVEDLAGEEINARYFAGRADGLAVAGGGRLVSAWVR